MVRGPFWFVIFLCLMLAGCKHREGANDPAPELKTSSGIDVVTYHNDLGRTGQNLRETILTPRNVNSASFGKLFFFPTDGKVDAEPLYLSNLALPTQGTHNVLFVATEHASVYAVDADHGALLWQAAALKAGETASDNRMCDQVVPEIGITATPVIDRNAGPHGTIYVVAMSKDGSGAYHQRLHALDVTTGEEEFGGPREIAAAYPGSGDNSSAGVVTFDPKQYEERAALLQVNGAIYTTWTSHCDVRPYTGWIISYDQHSLAQLSVLNTTPNGNEGAFWMSGAGPAADDGGNIYVLEANGTFDTALNGQGFPSRGDFGNAFLKLSTANGKLAVADYFEMFNSEAENATDADLGSGGVLLLPEMSDASGKVWHLAAGAGKDSNIYLVDRENLGKFNLRANNIYQELPKALSSAVFSMPAYFHHTLYYGAEGDNIKAFPIVNARLASQPSSMTAGDFVYPGATPGISANGTSDGILWAAENTNPAVLHAYDAADLGKELYNSNQAAGGRDLFGAGNKFITPMIANGKVYVASTTGVAVFGLLH